MSLSTIIHSYRNIHNGGGKGYLPCGIGDFIRGSIFIYEMKERHKNFNILIDFKTHPIGSYFKGKKINLDNLYVHEFFNHNLDKLEIFLKTYNENTPAVIFTHGYETNFLNNDCRAALQETFSFAKEYLTDLNYECIHLRFGDSLLHNLESPDNYFQKGVYFLESLKNKLDFKNCYLVSDSSELRNKLAEKFNLKVLNTKTAHTGFCNDESLLEGTVKDMYVISKSKKIYSNKSGFSKYLAKIFGIPYVEIV